MTCPASRPYYSSKTRGCVYNCWQPRYPSPPPPPRRPTRTPGYGCVTTVDLGRGKKCGRISKGSCTSRKHGLVRCVGSIFKGKKCKCKKGACFDRYSGKCKK